jgi:hypothetical protein
LIGLLVIRCWHPQAVCICRVCIYIPRAHMCTFRPLFDVPYLMCSFAIILEAYFNILLIIIRCFTLEPLASYLPSPEFLLNHPALLECFIRSSAQQWIEFLTYGLIQCTREELATELYVCVCVLCMYIFAISSSRFRCSSFSSKPAAIQRLTQAVNVS